MAEHVLFLTGHLAERRLTQVLQAMQPAPFTWEVRNIGVKVAALMTPDIIRRRLGPIGDATRVVVPGRCRGDLEALAIDLGVPVQQGPDELKDLLEFFGRKGAARDLSGHDCRIFAEIVEASSLGIDQILVARGGVAVTGSGRDRSGLPAGHALRPSGKGGPGAEGGGYRVSIDSGNFAELGAVPMAVPTSY